MSGNTTGAERATSRRWILVMRKELREIFRDRRTTFAVIISPLLITPGLFALLGSVIQSQVRKTQVETYRVGLVGAEHAPSLAPMLQAAPRLTVVPVSRAEAEARVRDRKLRAAVILPADTEARLREQRAVEVRVVVDPGNDGSVSGAQRLREVLAACGQRIVMTRLRDRQLSPELSTPFVLKDQPVPGGGTASTFMLAMMLPYVLTISAISGGLYAANDMVAGEKERGTLETLLVSPASRRELVLGKFLAIAAVCLLGSFLSVVGLMIPFVVHLQAFAWMSRGGLQLSAPAGAAILLVQLPLAVLFAGLLLAISTFARNQKEAQTYLGPLMLLVMVPAMMSMMLRSEAALGLAVVPVLNATMVLKQALSGASDPLFVAIAAVASVGYAALALAFATRLFENEQVLLKA